MGDFKEVIEAAKESGITLDTCGTAERHYSWGLYTDLCGMDVEEAMKTE